MLGGVAVTVFHVRPRAGLGSTAWSPQGFCPPPLQPGRKTLPGAGHPGLAARSPLGPGDRLVLGAVSPGCRWLLAAPPPSLAPGPQLLCTALVHGRLGEGWALPRPGPSGGASKPCPASGSEGDTWKEAQVAANSGFLETPAQALSWRFLETQGSATRAGGGAGPPAQRLECGSLGSLVCGHVPRPARVWLAGGGVWSTCWAPPAPSPPEPPKEKPGRMRLWLLQPSQACPPAPSCWGPQQQPAAQVRLIGWARGRAGAEPRATSSKTLWKGRGKQSPLT